MLPKHFFVDEVEEKPHSAEKRGPLFSQLRLQTLKRFGLKLDSNPHTPVSQASSPVIEIHLNRFNLVSSRCCQKVVSKRIKKVTNSFEQSTNMIIARQIECYR